MTLTHDELEFLSAWAREEWEPACYQLPSHRLQLGHSVSGAQLIVFIKAWTEGEGKKDQRHSRRRRETPTALALVHGRGFRRSFRRSQPVVDASRRDEKCVER